MDDVENDEARRFVIGGTARLARIEADRAGWEPRSWRHVGEALHARAQVIRPDDEVLTLPTDHLSTLAALEFDQALHLAKERGKREARHG